METFFGTAVSINTPSKLPDINALYLKIKAPVSNKQVVYIGNYPNKCEFPLEPGAEFSDAYTSLGRIWHKSIGKGNILSWYVRGY